eukprot:TRINITY_DN228_c0_g1_i1.p1 TRINITY_DN228_c0_g1~~TRINITY_DN228_c0_g1_i1.p1  ORF type:complete len:622 (-),score=229.14 TRINITY_DN228_c0_g1_i1:152-2017(-)
MADSETLDLKESIKERLFRDMIKAVQPPNGLKILIVDHESMRIISSACRMYDIMEEGVTLVEKIDIKRQPIPNLEAIYFLTPTEESVQLMCDDFKDARRPQYAAAHLFFTAHISEDLLAKIKADKIITKIKSLKELNLGFIAYESQAFHFDSPQSFHVFYSPTATDLKAEKSRLADKLVSVCATLNEYPIVRYGNTTTASSFAVVVQDKLDRLVRSSAEYSGSVTTGSNRAQLLILDRSQDPVAPILHELTYQAMIYDLLDISNDHYRYKITTNEGVPKDKEVVVGENDPLWSTVRHMHVADLLNWLLDGFNEFVKENKATKLTSKGGVSNLREMGDAMKAMPQFQEMLNKYSLHINMAGEAMNKFNELQLERIAGLEQTMSTGEDAEGNAPKNVVATLSGILGDDKIDLSDKIRLLIVYIISQEGIKDSDRRRLIEAARMKVADTAIITNLRYLGVSLAKGAKGKKEKKDKKKKRADAPSYDLSRFKPAVKSIGEDFVSGRLSTADFPATKDDSSSSGKQAASPSASAAPAAVSLRKSGQPRWGDKGGKKEEKKKGSSFSGPRFIIFVIGGITYSEMRSAYELSQKFGNQVIIGSSHIVTPKQYIDALRDLAPTEDLAEV